MFRATVVTILVFFVLQVNANIDSPAYCYEMPIQAAPVCDVPLEALISNPSIYNGYEIQTDGFLLWSGGDFLLFPNCQNAQAGRARGSISLAPEMVPEDYMSGYVYNVTGVFHASTMSINGGSVHLLPPWSNEFSGCVLSKIDG